MDPTILAALGLGDSFWAGGELASLGPQAPPGLSAELLSGRLLTHMVGQKNSEKHKLKKFITTKPAYKEH